MDEIRAVETAQLTDTDFATLGYVNLDEYKADWGDLFGSRLWLIRVHPIAPPTRGGKREGAGRKKIGEKGTEAVTVTLLPEHKALLSKLGEGNISAGVRELIIRYTKSN